VCEFVMQPTTEMFLALLASLLGVCESPFLPAGKSCLRRWSLETQLEQFIQQ